MIRFLVNTVINLASAAVALLIAGAVLDGVEVPVLGFVWAVLIFVVASGLLTPFIANMARKYAPAALGGIGLIATVVALWLATLFGGLTIRGVTDWILATVIVWLVTSLASWILFAVWGKKHLAARAEARGASRR
ncbi:superfamily IV 4 TMS phage holin [Salana multivorans]|uniref:Superfamily IV 4 TMS phage holin n=1 Tax=Salana multivorans TaxID=120377 RepID=A0A3N2DBY2_9MICO|nr:phage holin family protein [Salana multivorans]MBN8882312.1 phage holin family protein [Salana multivorans]OJX97716.1 MAG: hypothetical protein BGO96_12290 [Micrococcales bacterium 73-15]ROR97305.1 superfamily IV 4 TMS phage holin [Salana multivorans]